MTPLHLAAQNGNKEVVELLLAQGANIKAVRSNGSAPLHLAAQSQYGSKAVVELLLGQGGRCQGCGKRMVRLPCIGLPSKALERQWSCCYLKGADVRAGMQ